MGDEVVERIVPRDSEFETGRGRRKDENRDYIVVVSLYSLQVLGGCGGTAIWGQNLWISRSNTAADEKSTRKEEIS